MQKEGWQIFQRIHLYSLMSSSPIEFHYYYYDFYVQGGWHRSARPSEYDRNLAVWQREVQESQFSQLYRSYLILAITGGRGEWVTIYVLVLENFKIGTNYDPYTEIWLAGLNCDSSWLIWVISFSSSSVQSAGVRLLKFQLVAYRNRLRLDFHRFGYFLCAEESGKIEFDFHL